MAGATSLVELILKKWGDDIAGAAKELEEKVGFPESVANRIATGELPMDEASRQARKANFDGEEFFKGMYPYDWTKESGDFKGPVISEINRTTPFPSFGGSDGEVDIAGFMSKDPEVANRFAEYQSGSVFPLLKRSNSEHVIDAAGEHAGDIQFGNAGKPFRDAIRSGEHDSILIKNTADEGDVYVALDPSMIRSPNAAFDPQYTGSNIMGGATLPITAGLLAAGQSDDADASVVTPAIKSLLKTVGDADADRIAKEIEGGWFVHNTDKFDAPVDPARFGQDIEPSGQYITPTSGARDDLPENLIQGQKDFQNPLMLKSSGNYQNPENWKRQLSDMYGGATGQDLSDAVRADGYDGIYTLETGPRGSYLSEAVDLNVGKAGSRIEGGNADPRLLAGTAAGTAGLLAAPMLAGKDKPLPLPTGGDIADSVLNILGLPMTGLQGIARGLFGLATGEGLAEAAAQAGNTMDVGWKDGRVDMSNMNPDKGADQLEGYVTDVTGDPSLGWMAKMGLMLGSI